VVTIIKVTREVTRGKKAGTFGIQFTLSITVHTQYHSSHSVNGSAYSVAIQYYMDGPKSNENDFFCAAQKGQERKMWVKAGGGGTQVYSWTFLS
jgi:hypothetical protein